MFPKKCVAKLDGLEWTIQLKWMKIYHDNHHTPSSLALYPCLGDVQRAAPAAAAERWATRPWRRSHRCNRRPGLGFAVPERCAKGLNKTA